MIRDMNQEWGRLTNKMGSFAEDMMAPNFPHILDRRLKPHPADRSRSKEFDLIAWTSDIVFLNETISSPSIAAFMQFVSDLSWPGWPPGNPSLHGISARAEYHYCTRSRHNR